MQRAPCSCCSSCKVGFVSCSCPEEGKIKTSLKFPSYSFLRQASLLAEGIKLQYFSLGVPKSHLLVCSPVTPLHKHLTSSAEICCAHRAVVLMPSAGLALRGALLSSFPSTSPCSTVWGRKGHSRGCSPGEEWC